MAHQFRMYTINKGQMDEFVRAWREGVVPLREKLGFRVSTAWINRQTNQFVWVVSYDGPLTFEQAEQAYYALPERKTMDPDPASFIARMEIYMVDSAEKWVN